MRQAVPVFAASAALALTAGCERSRPYDPHEVAVPWIAPELNGRHGSHGDFHLGEQRGKVVVLSFGYAYCPDVCPMTLANLRDAYAKLGTKSEQVSVVFVTVDPERDEPDKLAEFVASFNPGFYGIVLDDASLALAKKSFGLEVYKRYPRPGSRQGYYFVDHTGLLFVLDRAGRVRFKVPVDVSIEDLTSRLRVVVNG
ncbi:MAG: SCO family protein [Proteobacteria bacterium]|nr:SCO family protein [Pseudomonadota bacterium]